MLILTHTHHSTPFTSVWPGHCHGNRYSERLMSHDCVNRLYSQQTHTHFLYYNSYEDLTLDNQSLKPLKKPWPTKSDFLHVSLALWIFGPHAKTNRFYSFIVTTGSALFAQPWIWVCPCSVYECVSRAHLAELRCARSSCGLSAGGIPCPLQDALISLAQAKPGGLPCAQRTVPKWRVGGRVLAEHGDLLRNSTRTQPEGLRS